MRAKKAVTHFVTQFTHVSKYFGVYSRKLKKIFRENCFENLVSDLKKNVLCPQNYFKKKVYKLKTKKHENIQNLWQSLGTKLVFLVNCGLA